MVKDIPAGIKTCGFLQGNLHAALPKYFAVWRSLSTSAFLHAAFKQDRTEEVREPDRAWCPESVTDSVKRRAWSQWTAPKHQNELSKNVEFTPLGGLFGVQLDSITNVIGLCSSVREKSYHVDRDGNPLARREIVLQDISGSAGLILWGNQAEHGNEYLSHIVAVERCKVLDYSTLSTTRSCAVVIDPAVEDARELEEWFQPLPADLVVDCGDRL